MLADSEVTKAIRSSRVVLNLFYKVSAEYASDRPVDLPRDSIVIYLMNHRSNADYVLVGYVLSGRVAISYAVGEWARIFPLEYIFKSVGAYFVRRKFRERLYHTVLERYVQLITRNGVTQGIFLEPWIDEQDRATGGRGLFAIERSDRLARVQALTDIVLEMRDVLTELNARVIHRERSIDETFDRAWRMLRMRRILVKSGDGYSVMPSNRPLVSYYANSVGHLLGPFADGVRERDALPNLAAK